MANLIVSSACNLACAYCFARPALGPAGARKPGAFVSLQAFDEYLNYLDRSGIGEARFLGGEPSLHPDFPGLIQRARQREKHVLVFTHGLLSEQALASLESLSPDEVTVLINMNAGLERETAQGEIQDRRRNSMLRLGARVIPGFTIATPEFQANFILPLMLEAGSQKLLRLGLAQPALAGNNAYLHPKQYTHAGRNIVRLAEAARGAGIALDFDCGFVPCMFSESDLQRLRECGVLFAWRCSPVIDLGLDGMAQHCFPLSPRFGLPFDPGIEAATLGQQLERQTSAFRVAGIYKECSSCRVKSQGECPGGCLAATLKRFTHSPFSLRLPAMPAQVREAAPNDQLIH